MQNYELKKNSFIAIFSSTSRKASIVPSQWKGLVVCRSQTWYTLSKLAKAMLHPSNLIDL